MKILIADDNPIALDLLQHTLTRSGYEVVTTDNGRSALEILRAVADPLLADCSLEWALSDQLDLSRRRLADVVRGIVLLEQTVAGLQAKPTAEPMEWAA